MRKCFLIIIFLFCLVPYITYASILNEVPPYVELEDVDEDDYIISKSITNDYIKINFEEKDSKIKYSWAFKKSEIKDIISINFDIDLDSEYKDKINKLTNNSDKLFISFGEDETLITKAEISIDVSSKYKNNDKLYLYYYDSKNDNVQFVKNVIVNEGHIDFETKYLYDYFITKEDKVSSNNIIKTIIFILTFFVIGIIGFIFFRKI